MRGRQVGLVIFLMVAGLLIYYTAKFSSFLDEDSLKSVLPQLDPEHEKLMADASSMLQKMQLEILQLRAKVGKPCPEPSALKAAQPPPAQPVAASGKSAKDCGCDPGIQSALSRENAILREKIKSLEKDNEKLQKSGLESLKKKSEGGGGGDSIPMKPQTEPYFCPPEVSSWDAWEEERKHIDWRFGDQAIFKNRYEIANRTKWWCNKAKSPLEPHIESKSLTLDDFVIGIYTGERIFYSRSSIAADSWLHGFKHKYLYAAHGEPTIPVVGLDSLNCSEALCPQYKLKPEYQDSYVTAYVQIWGLKDMYYRNPNAKWYYIVGCDTYLNTDYMMRALEGFDPDKDWVLTNGVYPGNFKHGHYRFTKWKGSMNITGWPKWWGKESNTFEWYTGAIGWFLSNSVAKAYAENIDKFMTDNDVRKVCYCPDKVTGMVLSLLGYKITKFPVEWQRAWDAMAVDGRGTNKWGVRELIHYHYVTPWKMVALHQKETHTKVDRLINTGDPNKVVKFFREFIEEHFTVLRRRMKQVKYLARAAKPTISYRPWDIPCVDLEVCKERPHNRRRRRLQDEFWDDLWDPRIFDDEDDIPDEVPLT